MELVCTQQLMFPALHKIACQNLMLWTQTQCEAAMQAERQLVAVSVLRLTKLTTRWEDVLHLPHVFHDGGEARGWYRVTGPAQIVWFCIRPRRKVDEEESAGGDCAKEYVLPQQATTHKSCVISLSSHQIIIWGPGAPSSNPPFASLGKNTGSHFTLMCPYPMSPRSVPGNLLHEPAAVVQRAVLSTLVGNLELLCNPQHANLSISKALSCPHLLWSFCYSM